MRNRDFRTALLLDHQHGRLYLYSPGVAPTIKFLQGEVPQHVRRISEDFETRHTEPDRLEHIKDFFKEALSQLEGSTEVVLVGPGTAKDELANRIQAIPRFTGVPVRTYTSSWMDEPTFEEWARETLHVPKNTPLVFLKGRRDTGRRRSGGPGAPVDPANYQRNNDLKAGNAQMGRQGD